MHPFSASHPEQAAARSDDPVCRHRDPDSYEPGLKHMNHDNRQCDADDPHSGNADNKGSDGIAAAPQDSGDDIGNSDGGFGESLNPQNLSACGNYAGIADEESHEFGSEYIQENRAGRNENNPVQDTVAAVGFSQLGTVRAEGLSDKGGCGYSEGVSRHIADLFSGVGELMRCQGRGSETGGKHGDDKLTA